VQNGEFQHDGCAAVLKRAISRHALSQALDLSA